MGNIFEFSKNRNICERALSGVYVYTISSRYLEITENNVKMAVSTLKTPKLGHFLRYLLEILCTFTPDRVPSHVFRSFVYSKISLKIFEKRYLFAIFKNSPNFENLRQQFDINAHFQPSVVNKSLLSFKLFALQRFP